MRISIIIPAWNLWNYTAACLNSLAATTPPGAAQVIVVDNGSTDETATSLTSLGKKLFGDSFSAVRLEENRGFAIGCNAGAAAATTDLLFFLNNDTTATPGWLEPLVAAFENPSTGGAGPLLLYPDQTIQHCGIFFDPLLRVGHLYEGFPADHPLPAKKRRLQAITGAALATRKTLFDRIGGFCEEYRNGYEDIDLCCHFTALGFQLQIVPESVFYHHTSRTPGRFASERNNSALAAKRLGGIIRPDLHKFAHADGYELKLWDCGLFRLELPEGARRAELESSSETAEALAASLHKEPLWRNGWQRLINAYARHGKPGNAIGTAAQALKFFPDQALIRDALKLSQGDTQKADISDLARIAREFGPLSGEQAKYIGSKLQKTRKTAADEKDKLLCSHIDAWLDQLRHLQADQGISK